MRKFQNTYQSLRVFCKYFSNWPDLVWKLEENLHCLWSKILAPVKNFAQDKKNLYFYACLEKKILWPGFDFLGIYHQKLLQCPFLWIRVAKCFRNCQKLYSSQRYFQIFFSIDNTLTDERFWIDDQVSHTQTLWIQNKIQNTACFTASRKTNEKSANIVRQKLFVAFFDWCARLLLNYDVFDRVFFHKSHCRLANFAILP